MPETLTLKEQLKEFEKLIIRKTIKKCMDVPTAAASLGVGQSTLYRRMRDLGLNTQGIPEARGTKFK